MGSSRRTAVRVSGASLPIVSTQDCAALMHKVDRQRHFFDAAASYQPEHLSETISIRKLSFYYRNVRVLKQISVPIYGNRVTAFMGPSRCGKSTLLRVLNRMYSLYSGQRAEGEVWFNGANILERKQDVNLLRARIGMIFPRPTTFPMSIYQNVAFGAVINRQPPRREVNAEVERALRITLLWDEVKDRLSCNPAILSVGQQQLLSLARVIANRPEVFLFDESCSYLDAASAAKIEQVIYELKQNYTVVMATNNLHQAARVSDFSGVIIDGELVEFDTAQILFTAPRDRRTEVFVTGRRD